MTFNPANIVDFDNHPIDAIRFIYQDTNTSAEFYPDATIQALYDNTDTSLSSEIRCYQVAYDLVIKLVARYAGRVDTNANGVSLSLSQLREHYTDLANQIRKTLDTKLYLNGANVIFARRSTTFV